MPGGFDAQQQIRLDSAPCWKEKNHDESENAGGKSGRLQFPR